MQQVNSSDIIGLFFPIRTNNPGHKVIIGYEDWQVINIIENDSY